MHFMFFYTNINSNSLQLFSTFHVCHLMTHTYDHQGRLIDDVINVDGPKTLATQVYNHRDKVIERNI
jgi:hypothetical protein